MSSYLNPRFIVTVGLLIRFLVIPFTLNWDLWANTRVSSTFGFNNLNTFYKEPLAVYPPLMYITLKSSLLAIKPFAGNMIDQWFKDEDISSVSSPNIYRYLFLIKIPYLLFDLATGFLFVKLFEKKKSILAYLVWFWNPIIIFLTCAWANVDIFAIFFIVASLWAHQKKRYLWGSAFLTLGISYKLFPIFLLPFSLMATPSPKKIIKSSFFCLLILLITHIPIFFSLKTYLEHAIIGGYRDLILFYVLPIGINRYLITVYLFYFLLFFNYLLIDKDKRNDWFGIYNFLVLAVIFSFSKFSLQWFLWLVPFLNIFTLLYHRLRPHVLVLYALYILMILFTQTSLNLGMLGPLLPSLWRIEYPLKSLIGAGQIDTLFNTLHTVFSACLILMGYYLLKKKIAEA